MSEWASPSKVVRGCVAFVVWWVFAVFPRLPLFPIGRNAGSLLGGTLMVILQVLSPDGAFGALDLPILALLFGTMVISIYLEKADLFRYLENALSWKTRGGMDLLCRLCLLAGLSSALFTNDTTCIILTKFVLKLCKEKKLRPKPFLLALACSANIGSAATPIGNPQNLVIAVSSGISFGRFLAGVLPAVVVGLLVNTLLLLLCFYRSLWLPEPDPTPGPNPAGISEDVENAAAPHPERITQSVNTVAEETPGLETVREAGNGGEDVRGDGGERDWTTRMERVLLRLLGLFFKDVQRWEDGARFGLLKRRLWKVSIYLVTLGMLAALLGGLSLPWTAVTAAVVMMLLDFSDAGPSLNQVNYGLLVFFCGMFIATSGFNATGAPEVFWTAVEPHSQINTASGVIVLSLVVIVLSNVVSNVPTVILLGGRVAASAAATGASSDKAWLILAWVSTVAGNLTLIGSAANIIVAEQARETQGERVLREANARTGEAHEPSRLTYNLTFAKHIWFGFPSTLAVIAVGLIPIVLRKF